MDSDKKVILGVLAGVAIGATLGILFAPDKGSNTRSKIAGTSEGYIDDLEAKFNELLDAMTGKVAAVKDDVMLVADRTMQHAADAPTEAPEPVK